MLARRVGGAKEQLKVRKISKANNLVKTIYEFEEEDHLVNAFEYFDERLYYTDEVRRTRSNRLSDSMFCLWKQGEKLRYYDISSQDYEELLQTLNKIT